eukprot:m.1572923 g.1572923  ORF g.1572923 m.1572923 type:complete len:96 (-) comp25303_c0_seq5:260-547(-)
MERTGQAWVQSADASCITSRVYETQSLVTDGAVGVARAAGMHSGACLVGARWCLVRHQRGGTLLIVELLRGAISKRAHPRVSMAIDRLRQRILIV